MKENFLAGLILVCIIVILVALMFSGIMWIGSASCKSKYSDYEPQFGILSGCRVVWEGKLTPTENIGLREIN